VNGREVVCGGGGLSGEDTTVMFVSVSSFSYLLWLRVVDQADHSAYESTLHSSFVS